MTFEQLLKHLRFEYHAEKDAECKDPLIFGIYNADKAERFPVFYDWLIMRRGFNRWQLSAHGIGRDIG